MNKMVNIILFLSLISLFCSKKEQVLTEIFKSNPDTTMTFEQYEAGKQPAGWTPEITSNQTKAAWVIVDNNGNKAISKSAGDNSGSNFNLLILNNSNYKDLKIAVKIKAISGKEDQGGGLVWRYTDKNNYYVARANPLESNFSLYREINGKREEFESAAVPLRLGEWFTIAIEMKGNLIKCFFNGKEEIEYRDDDNTFMNEGKIGLWTKADAISYFDDLTIEKLK
jgi:Domain of Unknown Function (DUF1080)